MTEILSYKKEEMINLLHDYAYTLYNDNPPKSIFDDNRQFIPDFVEGMFSVKTKDIKMKWIPVWKKIPEKDGMYLCDVNEHYGIFKFENGKFLPNEWLDYTGTTFKSHFTGGATSILFWMELPEFETLSHDDIKELKKKKQIKRKNEK